jgi:predicted alpha/beta hydrolase family esterase
MIYILVFIYYTKIAVQRCMEWIEAQAGPGFILHEIFRIEGTEPNREEIDAWTRKIMAVIKKDAKGTYVVGHVQAAAAAKRKPKALYKLRVL